MDLPSSIFNRIKLFHKYRSQVNQLNRHVILCVKLIQVKADTCTRVINKVSGLYKIKSEISNINLNYAMLIHKFCSGLMLCLEFLEKLKPKSGNFINDPRMLR